MKNRYLTALATIGLVLIMVTGCGNKNSAPADAGLTAGDDANKNEAGADIENDSSDSDETKRTLSDVSADIANKKAIDAYMQFLNNDRLAYPTPKFDTDSPEGEIYGFSRSEYDYRNLVQSLIQSDAGTFDVEYAFMDLGNDGTTEMIMAIRNRLATLMSTNVVLHFDGNDIQMTYAYSYGYRTEEVLYDQGYLMLYGSGGAGAHYSTLIEFEPDGYGRPVWENNFFFSSFATSIAYSLDYGSDDYPDADMFGDYTDDEFQISEFIEHQVGPDVVKIAVASYSEDEDVKASEQKFVESLKAHGAIEISSEEMESLTDLSALTNGGIEWNEWKDKGIVYVSYLDMVYPEPETYTVLELNNDEFCSPLYFTPDESVQDFEVIALEYQYSDYYGMPVFDYTVVQEIGELSADSPLVIYYTFMGDGLPEYGIKYTDNTGNVVIQAIEQSGYDGSIMLSDIYTVIN